ncbi:MAG: hypothetical protein WB711_08290 [Terriglobales bacterium]
MNEKQFGNLVVKVWRARQQYDAAVAAYNSAKTPHAKARAKDHANKALKRMTAAGFDLITTKRGPIL